MTETGQWYWCLKHERVEKAEEACRAEDRMGPYPSRDAALNWKEKVEERNEKWDEEDRRWKGEDDDW